MTSGELWKAASELPDKLFKLYMVIDKLADNNVSYCFASDETIANICGENKNIIKTSISDLINLNFLNCVLVVNGERRLYTNSGYKQYTNSQKGGTNEIN